VFNKTQLHFTCSLHKNATLLPVYLSPIMNPSENYQRS